MRCRRARGGAAVELPEPVALATKPASIRVKRTALTPGLCAPDPTRNHR